MRGEGVMMSVFVWLLVVLIMIMRYCGFDDMLFLLKNMTKLEPNIYR
jgi:hypothetical protein